MRRAEALSPLAAAAPPRRGCVGRGLTSAEEIASARDAAADCAPRADAEDGVDARRRFEWPAAIARSVPFRLGIAFWLLATLGFGLSGLFFYETLQQRLLARVDASIEDRLAGIERVFETRGIDGVVDIARQRDRLPMQTSMGFHLSDGAERIAGNVPVCPIEQGWSIVRGEDLGLDGDEGHYRFLTTTIGDYDLSLGRSLYALEELREVALTCLLWALAGSTLLAVAAAAFIARRMQRRIWSLRGAIGRVARGDLDARLPISGRCDDIDGMSGTINDALARLSRSVDGMRQVSTDIAHDLKTPLNRLHIRLEEAAERVRRNATGDDVARPLEEALEEARGIDATFEALLRIAQIEAGARRARFTDVDLGETIATVAEIYEPVVEAQGMTLRLELEPNATSRVRGDRELVTQLLVNLLENAVHHGGTAGEIRLSAGVRDGRPRLAVADRGPGIPPAERERVFRRLYRLERSRTTRGTGLGLSLVKAVADLHEGDIDLLDNAPGLVVEVSFPAVDEARERDGRRKR